MSSMYDTLKTYFTKAGFEIIEDPTNHAIGMNYKGENGTWGCIARAREEYNQFVYYSLYPVPIPQERQLAMMVFLTLVNFGMIVGNFEMDVNDGEVRFKSSIDVGRAKLQNKYIRPVVVANLGMMNKYFAGITRVIAGEDPYEVEADFPLID